MRRHDVRLALMKVPLRECRSEIDYLHALEKTRDPKMIEKSPVLKTLIALLHGRSLVAPDEALSQELIQKHALDQTDRQSKGEETVDRAVDQVEQTLRMEETLATGPRLDAGDTASGERQMLSVPEEDWRRSGSISFESHARSYQLMSYQRAKIAPELEDNLVRESEERHFEYLFTVERPSDPKDQDFCDRFADVLQRGLSACKEASQVKKAPRKRQEAPAGTKDITPQQSRANVFERRNPNRDNEKGLTSSDRLARTTQQMAEVYDQSKYDEGHIQTAFAAWLNEVSTYVDDERSSNTSSVANSQEESLFLCASRRVLKGNRDDTNRGQGGRDKPDMVCLEEPVKSKPGEQPSFGYMDLLSWGEVKIHARADLHHGTFAQHLRYAFRVVTENPMCGRQLSFTLCGRMLRIWYIDAQGYTHTRAIDVTNDSADSVRELALILLLLTGPSDVIQQKCTPRANKWYHVVIPATGDDEQPKQARLQIIGDPRFLSERYSAGLWGRRSCAFGDVEAIYEEGRSVDGRWQACAPHRVIKLVLKLTWLPEEVMDHEHAMLWHTESKDVKNVPRSRGRVQLPGDDWKSWTSERTSTTRKILDLEAEAQQLHLLVMVLECHTGEPLDFRVLPFDLLVRVYRHLVAKLYELAKWNIHYRDINLGNIRLHPNWRKMWNEDPDDESILLLIDFGNARLGDEPRAKNKAQKGAYLGLEDALSINGTFATSKSEERLEKELDLQKALAVSKYKDPEVSQRYITALLAAISKLGHRYPDDLESAAYCFLVQVLFHCRANPDFDPRLPLQFEKEVLRPILANKQKHWQSSDKLASSLETIYLIAPDWDKAVKRGFCDALEATREYVSKAQTEEQARATTPPELIPVEHGAFTGTLDALASWNAKLPFTRVPESAAGAGKRTRGASTDATAAKKEPKITEEDTDFNVRKRLPETILSVVAPPPPPSTNVIRPSGRAASMKMKDGSSRPKTEPKKGGKLRRALSGMFGKGDKDEGKDKGKGKGKDKNRDDRKGNA